MKIEIERCLDGSAQNRTENGVGTVASGTVSGGWSPLHGASAGISDPSYQSLVGRDGWERRERTAFDDLHRAGGDGRNRKYRRGCRCYRNRRTGRSVLDVDLSTSWNVYNIYGGLSGNFVWGRTLCLSGKWGWKLFRWKMLCPVLRAGVAWYGMYGTGGGAGG